MELLVVYIPETNLSVSFQISGLTWEINFTQSTHVASHDLQFSEAKSMNKILNQDWRDEVQLFSKLSEENLRQGFSASFSIMGRTLFFVLLARLWHHATLFSEAPCKDNRILVNSGWFTGPFLSPTEIRTMSHIYGINLLMMSCFLFIQ